MACLLASHPAPMALSAAAAGTACSVGRRPGPRLLAGTHLHLQQAAPLQASTRWQPWQAARRCRVSPTRRLPPGQPLQPPGRQLLAGRQAAVARITGRGRSSQA